MEWQVPARYRTVAQPWERLQWLLPKGTPGPGRLTEAAPWWQGRPKGAPDGWCPVTLRSHRQQGQEAGLVWEQRGALLGARAPSLSGKCKTYKGMTERPVYLLMAGRRRARWACCPAGRSRAPASYTGLACGLDSACTKLFDLRLPDPGALLPGPEACATHGSGTAAAGGCSAPPGAGRRYQDRHRRGLSPRGSGPAREASAARRGHARPCAASPPPRRRPRCRPAAPWCACPCGCRKGGSWLPPGVCSAGGARSPRAGAPRRGQTRTPPRGPSRSPASCAANLAVLGLKTHDWRWKAFHETVNRAVRQNPSTPRTCAQSNTLTTQETLKKRLRAGLPPTRCVWSLPADDSTRGVSTRHRRRRGSRAQGAGRVGSRQRPRV